MKAAFELAADSVDTEIKHRLTNHADASRTLFRGPSSPGVRLHRQESVDASRHNTTHRFDARKAIGITQGGSSRAAGL